ncbi:MAG: DUF4062 domain-containing protein [Thiolinea sp.]
MLPQNQGFYSHRDSLSMSYISRVFNVMIASPGDVASERAIIRDVIYEWNAVHSESREVVLLPIGWESHSSPEMGGSPQEIINNQILHKCDLLVGVFWTRIGTPTSEYASGTVEEIEEHISSGKPAMLYFSSQPVVMDTVDLRQVEELKEFKTSCQSRGLYEGYDSHADFKAKLYRHLQLKLNEHPLFKDINADKIAPPIESSTQLPELTQDARILLKEASLDPHGHILHIQYVSGTSIKTNGKNLIRANERREVARWEAALEELIYKGLLVERGHKGEVFEVSNLGYQIADMIEF